MAELVHVLAGLGGDEDGFVTEFVFKALAEALLDLVAALFVQVKVVVAFAEEVDLVEDEKGGLIVRLEVLEEVLDGLDLVFVGRVGNVDDVEEDVRFANLVEGGLEGFHEVVGELTDEPYGIGQEEGDAFVSYFAHGGIEGGEELVLGEDV